MSLNDLWKKFIRDEDEMEDEETVYYRPRKKQEAATLIDEPDDDMFRSPKGGAARLVEDYDEFGDELDDSTGKPRFKRVAATGIKSAEHAVDLICRKYVVLVNTEQVPDEALTPVRCYLAGAIRALGAHITPLDDENSFISIEPFDATPYLPHDEQDDLQEQQDDLI